MMYTVFRKEGVPVKNIGEVSRMTGVSVRTLQFYDKIGLLHPDGCTEAGYRLYGAPALERLRQILLFREVDFSLKEIKEILDTPDFDREQALRQQERLLLLKKERIEKQIAFTRTLRETGGENSMDFSAFDKTEEEAYAKQAKEQWGNTSAYREYEARTAKMNPQELRDQGAEMMNLFAELGAHRTEAPESAAVQRLVSQLRDFITAHFYTCTDEILLSLGEMYASGGKFTENIDRAGGKGTAEFAAKAIRVFCNK